MILGILSDTHDRLDAMRAGMDVLRAAGAAFFIHCGDVGSEQIIDQLAGEKAAFVWGNTDWDRASLARYAEKIGVPCYGAMADLTLDDKRIAVFHGDDVRVRQKIIAGQEYDYVFQGHTHMPADSRVGRMRWINPGALHRARTKTVATLDTSTDKLHLLTVDV